MTASEHPSTPTPPPALTERRAELKALYQQYGHDLFACLGYVGDDRCVVLAALTGQHLSPHQAQDLQQRVTHLNAHPVVPSTFEDRAMTVIRDCLPTALAHLSAAMHQLLSEERATAERFTLLAAALFYSPSKVPQIARVLRAACAPTCSGRNGRARLATDDDLLDLAQRLLTLNALPALTPQHVQAVCHFRAGALLRHAHHPYQH